MKRIYFVRHGITERIEKSEFQESYTPLSMAGREQADFVAKRFKNTPIDIVISSTMTRAMETADAIAKNIGKEIIHSDLFYELLRPTDVRGKKRDDPEVVRIIEETNKNFDNEQWKHSDEENFYDAKTRALASLKYLESLNEERILVVTHSEFLKTLAAVMIYGDGLTNIEFSKLRQFFSTSNTGISLVEEDNGRYRLLTWNDHEHLKDLIAKQPKS